MVERNGEEADGLVADEAALRQQLIDSVIDYAMFVLDPQGVVRTWNPGAQRLKGYRPEEIVGLHLRTFYTPADREARLPERLLAQAERDGAVSHSGWRVRKDGTTFWGDVTITALRDGAGTLLGFAKVTRDRTEVHDQHEALNAALERERRTATDLDRLHRVRTRFLASVVHDLTTPITVVRNALDLVAQQLELAPDDGPGRLLTVARRNADELERLRAQLQEFARLEAGRVELQPTTLDLTQVVADLAEDLAEAEDAAVVEIDLEPGTYVRADPLALRRILTNLLTNAVRHSPPDGTIRVVTAGTSAERVTVGVVDQGPGIRSEDKERVFDEFWSGREGRGSDRGLGLGLSIVHGYVQEHGGEVWVDSAEGRGATFWFTLDRAAAPTG
jgi:PAS domain S-box-containing protein